MKPALVTWVDSASVDGWGPLKKRRKEKPVEIWSVGWIVHEDDDRLVMVSHRADETKEAGGTWAIPRACVKSVVRLKQ